MLFLVVVISIVLFDKEEENGIRSVKEDDIEAIMKEDLGVDPDVIKTIINTQMTRVELSESLESIEIRKDYVPGFDLAEYIILEKYRNNSIDERCTFSIETNKQHDMPALHILMFEECYIVDLIERHSGDATDLDNWKFNYKYLKNHYDEIYTYDGMLEYGEILNFEEIGQLRKWYMDSYIEVYTHIDEEG